MSRLRRVPQGESGAVAVVVSLLSVVLIGISAFTVDFGMSYVSTRQLQVASDAAALAAAAQYSGIPGDCPTMLATAAGNGTDVLAQNTGNDLMTQDRPGSTRTGYSVWCDSGKLKVKYTSSGTTPSFFGPIFGRNAAYQTDRTAVATVSVSPQANARPYALCSGQLPATIPGATIVKLQLPDPSSPDATACPTAEIGGNWWTVRCPEDSSNGELDENTLNGCKDPLSIVPNQPVSPTPSSLSSFLISKCPVISQSCLGTNTGNIGGTGIITVWDQFVLNQTTLILPVFCGEPNCDPSAINNPSGGGNIIYPIYKLAAVKICGYHWGPKSADNLTGDCGPAYNPSGYNSSQGGSTDNYLLVKPTALRVSGGTAEFACDLGAGCDGGARRVLLTE